MTEPQTPDEWAAALKRNWEDRAGSPARDFFVASHPGWQDQETWGRRAEADVALFLHGLDADWLAGGHALEIGCGVGRLATPLARRVTSYTGFDIAAGMVAEARRRCECVQTARFLEGDGLHVPDEARDRTYRLVVAVAVFIHCPAAMVGSLVGQSYALLEQGGEIRFQLLADPDDPEGITELQHVPQHEQEVHEQQAELPPGVRELSDDRYYMGHRFTYREAAELLSGVTGGEVRIERFDPTHLYGSIRRS
jgi:SAM-dependent methyltransferase